MWEHTYNQQILQENDKGTFRIMRSRELQEVINILIPEAPPLNRFEYQMAGNIFLQRILASQPHILDESAPPELAYKIEKQVYAPFILLGHHARVAILNMAMGEYRSGLGCILTMQETACQFQDVNILMGGGKLGFSMMAFLVPNKHIAKDLYQASLTAMIPTTKKDELGTKNHSRFALDLCNNLYGILAMLATMNDGDQNHPATDLSRKALSLSLDQHADEIDKSTTGKFNIRGWVNETVQRLATILG